MADNYLERKYEEFLAAKNGKTTKYKFHSPTPDTPKYKHSDIARRVFVTGGADGIGQAIVKAFASSGHKVAFCDINEALGRMTANECGAAYYKADVTDETALSNAMNKIIELWGDIDIIINNVGISTQIDITDSTISDFDKVINTNLRPVYITARTLALQRKSVNNDFGRIINISSTRALMSEPGWEGYAASKGGINSLTHALAISLAKFHITVNAISPGWIQTKNYNTLIATDHSQHPSQRVGKPDDIARACIFLCNSDSDFINGENIVIDGGMTKKMIYAE